MDKLDLLRHDLENGFSKADLERLIGLPKNSLCAVLAGKKILSKKSALKVQRWNGGSKPNPLEIATEKQQEKTIKKMASGMGKTVEKFDALSARLKTIPKVENHPLWKEGDPKENSAAFMMKYGVANYDELSNVKS